MFHPSVPNAEGFDRGELAKDLPWADEPKLPAGPGGRGVLLVVVGHDGEVFAEEGEKVCFFLSLFVGVWSWSWSCGLCG
jgi:hypothetical protein